MSQPRWIYRVSGSILIFSAVVLGWTLLNSREKVLVAGTFHSVAHKGAGEARVVTMADGQRMLRLVDVRTYPAAGLEVCLVGAPDAEDNDTLRQSGFICVGGYNPRSGYAAFALPATIDLGRYQAVAIWNREYGVNFTTAPLAK